MASTRDVSYESIFHIILEQSNREGSWPPITAASCTSCSQTFARHRVHPHAPAIHRWQQVLVVQLNVACNLQFTNLLLHNHCLSHPILLIGQAVSIRTPLPEFLKRNGPCWWSQCVKRNMLISTWVTFSSAGTKYWFPSLVLTKAPDISVYS